MGIEKGGIFPVQEDVIDNSFIGRLGKMGKDTRKLIEEHALPMAKEYALLPVRFTAIATYGYATELFPPSGLLRDFEAQKHYFGVLWAISRGKPGSISIAEKSEQLFRKFPTYIEGVDNLKTIPDGKGAIIGSFHWSGDPMAELEDSFWEKVGKIFNPDDPLKGFWVAPKQAEIIRTIHPDKQVNVIVEIGKYPFDDLGEKIDQITNGQYVPWEHLYYNLPGPLRNIWETAWNAGKQPVYRLIADTMDNMSVTMNFIPKEKGWPLIKKSLKNGNVIIVFEGAEAENRQKRAVAPAGKLSEVAEEVFKAGTYPAASWADKTGLHVCFGPRIDCHGDKKNPDSAQITADKIGRGIDKMLPPKFRRAYVPQ